MMPALTINPAAVAASAHILNLGTYNSLPVKLQWLCAAAAARFPTSLIVLQAWLPCRGSQGDQDFCLFSEPQAAVVSDPSFHAFRVRSCQCPVQFKTSMTGRVWKTGAVQVVQNLRLVPPTMHPRIYLTDAELNKLGEALYIPVYDPLRPTFGPITVLEALLPACTAEPVISADLLSFISAGLATLQLSVSNPMPQPILRSALCGRRARAPNDSAPDLTPSTQAGVTADAAVGIQSIPGNDVLPVVTAGAAVKALSSPPTLGQPKASDKDKTEEDTAAQTDLKKPHLPLRSVDGTTPSTTGTLPPVTVINTNNVKGLPSCGMLGGAPATTAHAVSATCSNNNQALAVPASSTVSSGCSPLHTHGVRSTWCDPPGGMVACNDATDGTERVSKRAKHGEHNRRGMVRSKSSYHIGCSIGVGLLNNGPTVAAQSAAQSVNNNEDVDNDDEGTSKPRTHL